MSAEDILREIISLYDSDNVAYVSEDGDDSIAVPTSEFNVLMQEARELLKGQK